MELEQRGYAAVTDLFDFVLHPSPHALTDVVVLRESRADAVELLIPCDGILLRIHS